MLSGMISVNLIIKYVTSDFKSVLFSNCKAIKNFHRTNITCNYKYSFRRQCVYRKIEDTGFTTNIRHPNDQRCWFLTHFKCENCSKSLEIKNLTQNLLLVILLLLFCLATTTQPVIKGYILRIYLLRMRHLWVKSLLTQTKPVQSGFSRPEDRENKRTILLQQRQTIQPSFSCSGMETKGHQWFQKPYAREEYGAVKLYTTLHEWHVPPTESAASMLCDLRWQEITTRNHIIFWVGRDWEESSPALKWMTPRGIKPQMMLSGSWVEKWERVSLMCSS